MLSRANCKRAQARGRDIIAIGNLLVGSHRNKLEHGEWLLWLKSNFGLSIRSAQNYMAVARFASKYATVRICG